MSLSPELQSWLLPILRTQLKSLKSEKKVFQNHTLWESAISLDFSVPLPCYCLLVISYTVDVYVFCFLYSIEKIIAQISTQTKLSQFLFNMIMSLNFAPIVEKASLIQGNIVNRSLTPAILILM